jgi:hypothetical protein
VPTKQRQLDDLPRLRSHQSRFSTLCSFSLNMGSLSEEFLLQDAESLFFAKIDVIRTLFGFHSLTRSGCAKENSPLRMEQAVEENLVPTGAISRCL